MCEVVLYGNSEFSLYNDGWSPDDKNALAHMKALELFEFIYSLYTLSRSWLYLKMLLLKFRVKMQI